MSFSWRLAFIQITIFNDIFHSTFLNSYCWYHITGGIELILTFSVYCNKNLFQKMNQKDATELSVVLSYLRSAILFWTHFNVNLERVKLINHFWQQIQNIWFFFMVIEFEKNIKSWRSWLRWKRKPNLSWGNYLWKVEYNRQFIMRRLVMMRFGTNI